MAMCDEGLSIEEYEGMKKRREQQAVKLAQCEEAMEKVDPIATVNKWGLTLTHRLAPLRRTRN
jgi:hypothetical protein